MHRYAPLLALLLLATGCTGSLTLDGVLWGDDDDSAAADDDDSASPDDDDVAPDDDDIAPDDDDIAPDDDDIAPDDDDIAPDDDDVVGPDDDGDGYTTTDGDCDDSDAAIHPGAIEACDGLDNDCDGSIDVVVQSFSNGTDVVISSTDTPTVTSNIDVSASGPLPTGLQVALTIFHTWDEDLSIELTAPWGATVMLSEAQGGDGDNYVDTVFADAAATSISAGSAPFSGSFQPEQSLDSLAGGEVQGTWVLTIADSYPQDGGHLDWWSLQFEVDLSTVDADGDGSDACTDCDDADAANAPGGVEVCDGQDNDCNGAADFAGEDTDVDGDGSPTCLDCDDGDAANFPGGVEACDGQDNDCDATTVETADGDGDGVTLCDGDCEDTQVDTQPGAPPLCDGFDNDCDGTLDDDEAAMGDSAACPGATCDSILQARAGVADGTFWIEVGATIPTFQVDCDMTSEGGGWFQLSVNDSDQVLVAQQATTNPWTKCDDDGAMYFGSVAGEAAAASDMDTGGYHVFPVGYLRPSDGAVYSSEQLDGIRSLVDELHPDTRMVAVVADGDYGDWHNGDSSGHEVYVGSNTDLQHLTVGVNGDCGGTSGFPTPGSGSGFYLWHTDASQTAVDGDTDGTVAGDLGALPGDLIIPPEVHLVVYTGGGAAWGYEQAVFGVR